MKYYRIKVSQLSLFGACKVSHFEIVCRAHNFAPMVALFWRFYVNSMRNGWFSFGKRAKDTGTCYDRPLDFVKLWSDRFFLVDTFACPSVFPWRVDNGVEADLVPQPGEYIEAEYPALSRQPAPFCRHPKAFLCWIGLSCYYSFTKDEYPIFLLDGEGLYYLLTSSYPFSFFFFVDVLLCLV